MLNKSKSLHCKYPEEPYHTLDKCPYDGRLIQKLWNEQQNKKKKIHPDEIVPAATQRRKDNLLASMPGDYIMSTSVWRHFDVVCLLRLNETVWNA